MWYLRPIAESINSKNKMLSPIQRGVKRTFDLVFSLFSILLTGWIMLIAWIIASWETKSSGLFRQERVGRDGKLFHVFKIKTMKEISGIDTTVTTSEDRRITGSGAFFRKSKIDELLGGETEYDIYHGVSGPDQFQGLCFTADSPQIEAVA